MYSLESFPNAHMIYSKYAGNRMTGLTSSQTTIQPTALYLLQENTAIPSVGQSNKFMLWGSDMSTPLAEFTEVKASK